MIDFKKHAPLIIVTVFAIIITVSSFFGVHTSWWSSFSSNMAAEVWGAVILMVVFDITPRRSQEKKEGGA